MTTLCPGFLFVVLLLVGNASAATYIVGDTLGWTVPPSPAAYAAWASRQTFRLGDVLVFNYNTGFHDVAHVTKAAYDGCSSNNPIALVTVGPSNFTLSTPGQDYYICTFGSHCANGQKLAINVTAPAPTMPPSTTPMPPSTSPMPPSTTPVPPSTSPMPPSTSPAPTMPPSTSPAPIMPPSTTPAPTMPPTTTPVPSSSTPGSMSSPPAPASESTPGRGVSPPPNSATVSSICAPLLVFASLVFALLI